MPGSWDKLFRWDLASQLLLALPQGGPKSLRSGIEGTLEAILFLPQALDLLEKKASYAEKLLRSPCGDTHVRLWSNRKLFLMRTT